MHFTQIWGPLRRLFCYFACGKTATAGHHILCGFYIKTSHWCWQLISNSITIFFAFCLEMSLQPASLQLVLVQMSGLQTRHKSLQSFISLACSPIEFGPKLFTFSQTQQNEKDGLQVAFSVFECTGMKFDFPPAFFSSTTSILFPDNPTKSELFDQKSFLMQSLASSVYWQNSWTPLSLQLSAHSWLEYFWQDCSSKRPKKLYHRSSKQYEKESTKMKRHEYALQWTGNCHGWSLSLRIQNIFCSPNRWEAFSPKQSW